MYLPGSLKSLPKSTAETPKLSNDEFLLSNTETVRPLSPRLSETNTRLPSVMSRRARSTAETPKLLNDEFLLSNTETVRPLSPRLSETNRSTNPVSPRLSSVMSRVRSTVQLVEKKLVNVMEMKRESNDVNMVVDKIMFLIDKYDDNSEIRELLKVHPWERINKVLMRLAWIYAIRWQVKEVLIVVGLFKSFDYFGDEVMEQRNRLVSKLADHLREFKHEELDKWVEELLGME